jgi:tetratricopeptide (TPR) repeat protein
MTWDLALALALWLVSAPLAAAVPAIENYRETIEDIVTGFNNKDAQPFNRAIDANAIADKALDLTLADANWKAGVRDGMLPGLNSMGQKILNQLAPDSYVKLLRLKQEGEQGRALLRFDYGDQGIAYLDFFLKAGPGGEVRIVDWYDYSRGQRYASSLQQMAAIMSPTPTKLGKLFDVVSERREAANSLLEILKLHVQQKHKAAAEKFLSQDERYLRSRLLNLIAVQSANITGDLELYRKVLANLARYHGDDEDLFLVLMDYYLLEEEYDKVLRGLDKFLAHFGVDDAGLEVVRATTLYYKGDYGAALSASQRAIAMEPAYEYGYWTQLVTQAAMGDYAGGVTTARLMEQEFDYDMSPEALAEDPDLAPLVESQAYRSWRAGR